jgi:hypothetical protein
MPRRADTTVANVGGHTVAWYVLPEVQDHHDAGGAGHEVVAHLWCR